MQRSTFGKRLRVKPAALCSTLAVAMFVAEGSADQATECPEPAGSEVVVKALRFSDGRSYAFMVTNNGPGPIFGISIGWGGPPYIEVASNTKPVSMGSPCGWEGLHLVHPDPRLPKSHGPTHIRYYWAVGDDATPIEPGRSLAGFSVQLPTPREAELEYVRHWKSLGLSSELPTDPPLGDRLPPQPDLTRVSFEAYHHRPRCGEAVGTVVPERATVGGEEGTLPETEAGA